MNKPRSARPLSDLVRPALADALKAQGFAAADILRNWPDIAGERLGACSIPLRVMWPPRPKAAPPDAAPQPATLILKVESAFALEVEMAAAQIIERVNAVYGWRCIGQVRLRQGPVPQMQSQRTRRRDAVVDAVDPATGARLARDLEGIEEDGLRAALETLGRRVLARKPVTRE